MTTQRPEGWYPDPDNPDRLRWFDGQEWGRVEPLDNEPAQPPDATFWSAVENAPGEKSRSWWAGPLLWSPLLIVPLLIAGRATGHPAFALGAGGVMLGWLAQVGLNAANARREPPQPPLPMAVWVVPTLLVVAGALVPWFYL